jgi:hypothetical protein
MISADAPALVAHSRLIRPAELRAIGGEFHRH